MNRKMLLIAIVVVVWIQNLCAQENRYNEVIWSGSGYSLKKVVSDTLVPSGVNFTYTILFAAPAGETTVAIRDEVPAGLQLVSVPPAQAVNGVTPVINIAGNLVEYTLSGLPTNMPSSGSFTIIVRFAAGTTCHGTVAENRAGIRVDQKWVYTDYLKTKARAVVPFNLHKKIATGFIRHQSGDDCPYNVMVDDTVSYFLNIDRNYPYWNTNNGIKYLENAVVYDTLPQGAQLIMNMSWVTHGTLSFQNGIVTWNIGPISDQQPAAQLRVYYPGSQFPVGTISKNRAWLLDRHCGSIFKDESDHTCFRIVEKTVIQKGTLAKGVQLADPVPGCRGVYMIVFRNTGTTPLTDFVVTDQLPAGIRPLSLQLSNLSQSLSASVKINQNTTLPVSQNNHYGFTNPTVNHIEAKFTGTIQPNQYVLIDLHFRIDEQFTGTEITNCAQFSSLNNELTVDSPCVTFQVEPANPVPCVSKSICAPKAGYVPGDIVRFRLRVLNVGSQDIFNASLSDVLHPSLEYVGNEKYYYSALGDVACTTGSNLPTSAIVWSGVSASHSGNQLSWSAGDIKSNCEITGRTCNPNYPQHGVNVYYIEFDARIAPFSRPGTVKNSFILSGDNIAPTESNTQYISILADFGQEVTKKIKVQGSETYTDQAQVSPGTSITYRLEYRSTSNVPVKDLKMAELLPRNDGSNDWQILNRNLARGSTADLNFTGQHQTSVSGNGPVPTPQFSYSTGNNVCIPGFPSSGTCNTVPWGPSIGKNILISYPGYEVQPNGSVAEDLGFNLSYNLTNGQKICNDFAAMATAEFYLNGELKNVTLPPVPSKLACAEIIAPEGFCCDKVVARQDGTSCCARIISECDVTRVRVVILNGKVSSADWACGSFLNDIIGKSDFEIQVAQGCKLNLQTCITPTTPGAVKVTYTLYFANGNTCEKTLDLNCATPVNCCDDLKIEKMEGNNCGIKLFSACNIASIDITVKNGKLGPATWNCTETIPNVSGLTNYVFYSNGCLRELNAQIIPDGTGEVKVDYFVAFQNGARCMKDFTFQCGPEYDCCDSIKVENIQGANFCTKITSVCGVKSVDIAVINGKIKSVKWPCTGIGAGFEGQTSFTLPSNDCKLDMENCFEPIVSTRSTMVVYTITLANGKVCEKVIELKTTPPVDCCRELTITKLEGTDCGVKLSSYCKINSVDITITNGKISSSSWDCPEEIPDAAGQNSYVFYSNACMNELLTKIIPNGPGEVKVEYFVNFQSGARCMKEFSFQCGTDYNCCDSIKVVPSIAPGCCVNVTSVCGVKSVDISVANGKIRSLSWPCTGIGSGFEGQTRFTVPSNGCKLDMNMCFDPVSIFEAIVVTYTFTLSNGEICTREIELCKPEIDMCCIVLDTWGDKRDCKFRLSTECGVKSVSVTVQNGLITELESSCGTPPSVGTGISQVFMESLNCPLILGGKIKRTAAGPISITYEVTFMNGNKCIKTYGLDCDEPATGLNQNQVLPESGDIEIVSIIPNPNPGRFNLTLNANQTGIFKAKVINIFGQTVYEYNNLFINNGMNEHWFELPRLSPGTYLIILGNDQIFRVKPFVIK